MLQILLLNVLIKTGLCLPGLIAEQGQLSPQLCKLLHYLHLGYFLPELYVLIKAAIERDVNNAHVNSCYCLWQAGAWA